MTPPAYLRRPLGLIALFTALVLAGVFCWPRLPVDLLPRLPHPRLTVITSYPNAQPQEVEALVTRRLEAVLATVAGVTRLQALSAEGVSTIKLTFDWGRELSPAAAEVREKLDSIADQLPREAEPPLVLRFDPSEAPVITLALAAPGYPPELRQYAEETLKTKLETTRGVAAVRLMGGLQPEVQVLADRARLVAQRVDLGLLVSRIEKANLNSPAGEVRVESLEVPVRTVGRFDQPDQLLAVSLREETKRDDRREERGERHPASATTLGEVAQAVLAHKDVTGFCRVDGDPVVLLSLLKEPEANTVTVCGQVRERMAELAAGLPAGWRLAVVEDQAPFIEESLDSLGGNLLWGALLSFLALWLSLRRFFRAALVVLSAPVAVLATLGLMHLCGVGLNLMSIGGLALGVGMLVDGSIEVLDAYHRYRRSEDSPLAAAALAIREVRGGLVCGTVTTAVVLVPILFLTGLAQRLFSDFAFTLVASLVLSLATAVLLVPALLIWRARPRVEAPPARPWWLTRWFLAVAELCLRLRWLACLAGLLATVAAGLILAGMGAALLPELSGGRALLQATLPPGSGVTGLTRVVEGLAARLAQDPTVARTIWRAGVEPEGAALTGLETGKPNQALATIQFTSDAWQGQGRALIGHLRDALRGSPGVEVEVTPAGDLAAPGREGFAAPELLVLLGEDLDALRPAAEKILARLRERPELTGLTLEGASQIRQLSVRVDRPSVALLGLSVSQVAHTVSRAVQGEVAGKLLQGDRQLDIRVRLRPEDRADFSDLADLPLTLPGGGFVRLSQTARLAGDWGPEELWRLERRPAILIRGQVASGPFSRGQDQALAAAREIPLPPGGELRAGAARVDLAQSLASLSGALLLALGLVYVILVVRFESLREPLVVILSLPPMAIGPALSLWLAQIPVSALVLLGGVVLLGVAVDGAILMVEYTDQQRAAGLATREALLTACRVRLTPLFLSMATTVLGALPLCLGLGGGEVEISRPLALTVVSGLGAGFLGNLLLVPALYSLLAGPVRGRAA